MGQVGVGLWAALPLYLRVSFHGILEKKKKKKPSYYLATHLVQQTEKGVQKTGCVLACTVVVCGNLLSCPVLMAEPQLWGLGMRCAVAF